MEKETMIGELVRLVGKENVLSSAMHFKLYEYDASLNRSKPDCIVLPTSTEQVSKVVKFAHDNGIPHHRPGGRDEPERGERLPSEGGIALVLTKMNQILEMDIENQRVVVQPGVVTLDLKNVLAKYGYLYQPDPASEKVTTIGGNFGENAGGPHCLKYGVTSNHVLGAEVVLSDGEVVQVGGKALDNPGFDLLGVLGASEGTLGDRHRGDPPDHAEGRGGQDDALHLRFHRGRRQYRDRHHRGGDHSRHPGDDGQPDDQGRRRGVPRGLSPPTRRLS